MSWFRLYVWFRLLTLFTLFILFTNIAVVTHDGLWELYAVIFIQSDGQMSQTPETVTTARAPAVLKEY